MRTFYLYFSETQSNSRGYLRYIPTDTNYTWITSVSPDELTEDVGDLVYTGTTIEGFPDFSDIDSAHHVYVDYIDCD